MRSIEYWLRYAGFFFLSVPRRLFGIEWSSHRPIKISKHGISGENPPPMHWSPCDPSTITKFKATMTCPNGHVLTLRIHSIAPDGGVTPSVVCPAKGCSFHSNVRLAQWTYGAVR